MIDKRLGCWVIDKELGRGGMGRVYHARRDAAAAGEGVEEAALKVLAAELAQDAGFLHRFHREIDALRLLDHPHIVKFYESGKEENQYYYAMEYIAGRNFDELLRERGRLPWKEVVEVALQVCPAIKHAHDHGIIHRDLKPQNLMRAEDGTVKLADFGVAKVFASRQLTATGGLIGTAEFISPEQAAGKPVSVRSDLYSFGVVLYTLLTGRLPFQGTGVLDLLHKHRYAQFDRPQLVVVDIPHELNDIVCSLLEKDPEKRPATALVLQRQLEALRRKLDRKDQLTDARLEATRADNAVIVEEPGPATLMSQLMREEIEKQRRAGPLTRFFNHPAVLVALLLLCIGLFAWGLWPLNAAQMFERGAHIMETSDSLADWENAWSRYFEPLARKNPDLYTEQLRHYRQQIDDRKEEMRAARPESNGTPNGTPSEAQRLYLRGERLRKEGDVVASRRTWKNVAIVFQGVDSEKRWVRLAEKGLASLDRKQPADEQERWAPVRAALERARALPLKEAEPIYRALEELYRDDLSATDILQEVRRGREMAR